jgi:hypothetical protein
MSKEQIKLTDIIKLDNPSDYYAHLPCLNRANNQPLDAFLNNENEYKQWQEWKGNEKGGKIIKEKFPKRDYIISFANVYYEGNDIHLFTGIYKIVKRLSNKYEVEKLDLFQNLIGKLKIKHKRKGQGSAYYLENSIDDMIVYEVMQERLECRVFDGLNKINLRFPELKIIIEKNIKEWRLRLDNLRGVYLLVDDSNNKIYVGSACGKFGIWQRWSNYIHNYTGGNIKLDELHKKAGEEHFKRYFRFVLLEYFTDKIDKDYIIGRENFWKEALNTRNLGYNNN